MSQDNNIAFESVEALWEKLQGHESNSLLKKHLTQEIYDQLKDVKTPSGGTLAHCIQSGANIPKCGVGLYACDKDAYEVFSPLFDAVIQAYHGTDSGWPGKNHPDVDFQEDRVASWENLDPEGSMVNSTRIRVGRSAAAFQFPPMLSDGDRAELEKLAIEAFGNLTDDLSGKYYSLSEMSEEDKKQLISDHFLFKDEDEHLRQVGAFRNWPNNRGIFHNVNKTFLSWVSEEDHFRLISMQPGADIGEVYTRLVKAIKILDQKVPFAHDAKRGYLTFCPTNLGTALRASVHIRIPKLHASGKIKEICDKYKLQPRGVHGEHSETDEHCTYDISNKHRLGLTEFEAIQQMYNGVQAIIAAEKNNGIPVE